MVVHDALTAPAVKAIRVVFPSCLAAATVEVGPGCLAELLPLLWLLLIVEAQAMVRLGALDGVCEAGSRAMDEGRGRAGDDISSFGAEESWFSLAVHLESAGGVEKVQLL